MKKKKAHNLSLQPAKRQRLSDILYGQILEQMSSGQLKKGDQLPTEQALSAAFGVSRPVVREALMRLQADGLVKSRQGAGTFVEKAPPPNLNNLTQLEDVANFLRSYEIRIGLETEAAYLAARNRTEKQLAKIKAALLDHNQKHQLEGSSAAEDFEFHLAIAEATGNLFFLDLLQYLRKNVVGQMSLGNALALLGTSSRRNHVLAEHEKIVDAIEAQDCDAAAALMRHHLTQSRDRTTDSTRQT